MLCGVGEIDIATWRALHAHASLRPPERNAVTFWNSSVGEFVYLNYPNAMSSGAP